MSIQGVSHMWEISIVSVPQHTCRHSGSWASSCFPKVVSQPFQVLVTVIGPFAENMCKHYVKPMDKPPKTCPKTISQGARGRPTQRSTEHGDLAQLHARAPTPEERPLRREATKFCGFESGRFQKKFGRFFSILCGENWWMFPYVPTCSCWFCWFSVIFSALCRLWCLWCFMTILFIFQQFNPPVSFRWPADRFSLPARSQTLWPVFGAQIRVFWSSKNFGIRINCGLYYISVGNDLWLDKMIQSSPKLWLFYILVWFKIDPVFTNMKMMQLFHPPKEIVLVLLDSFDER